MRKIVSAFLTFVIAVLPLACALPAVTANADSATDELVYKCGDNATWSLNTETGVLTIAGTGKTYSYGTEQAPWRAYGQYIKHIVVEEGITEILEGAFAVLNNVVSLTLPSTLETIWADADFYALETISVPEKANLRCIKYSTFASKSKWLANIPENSPVYIGPLLFKYKGTVPENTTLVIKDGTKAVNCKAFKNAANITDIVFPATLDYVGEAAFEGTGWYESLPDGAVYAGNVLYAYKGVMQLDEADFVVKDGTKSIADKVFYNNTIIGSVTIPASVEIIGKQTFDGCRNITEVTIPENSNLRIISDGAFQYANITEINLPESLEIIGAIAFTRTNLNSVYIPSKVKVLEGAFNEIPTIDYFEVSPDNLYYCSDKDGVLFNKDKTVLCYFPSDIKDYEYTIPDGVTYICDYAFSFCDVKKIVFCDGIESTGKNIFYQCYTDVIDLGKGLEVISLNAFYDNWSTDRLTVPENIKLIEQGGLGFQLKYLYFPGKEVVFDTRWINSSSTNPATFFCYEDSTAYDFAVENDIPVVLFNDENTGDYSELEYAVKKFNSVSETKKAKSAYWNAAAVVENIPWNIDASYQTAIDDMTAVIEASFTSMKIVWTDYTAVDEAIERANAIDRDLYSAESLARLDAAVNSVERHCDVADEALIDEYVESIDGAIELLEIKTGDYTQMNEVLEIAKNIDRALYTAESLGRLDNAVSAAENAETTFDQSIINAYTKAVREAIENLEYLPADYSALDELKEKCSSLDRSLYTAESLQRLDDALKAAEEKLTVDKQAQADALIEAAQNAYDLLEYLPADYSAVEQAKERVSALDRRYYSEKSLIILDNAVKTVVYGLDITGQARVDGFAQTINAAIDSLEYASIVLRHEPCGVIVSATTKEIKPDTVLAVEEVDSSEHEGTNFAVGGSIRSLHFYDINLVCETVTVQPDGTVTVKIKLADGVDPSKCKVYHVTDDIVNPLVRFASTIDGNYIAFETDHFSEFAVIEVEPVLTGIEISSLPAKTAYGIGEGLDISGMEIVAYFSDGSSRTVEDYDVGSVNTESIGTKKVMVYYTFGGVTKTAELEITVAAENASVEITRNGKSAESVTKKLGLFSLYSKASVQLGCNTKNSTGLSVQWSSDNSKVSVDANGKVTCKGLFGAKKANVTVKLVDGAGNVIASDTVVVVFYKLAFQLPSNLPQTFNTVIRKIYFV